jgi:hypothetical protein
MLQINDLRGFISVKRIKEISFSLNEVGYIEDPNRVVKSELSLTLGHIINRNLVQLVIRIYYHYEDSPNPPYLVDTVVQTIFEIVELNKYKVSDDEIKLPPEVIILLTDQAVSHARAFLAKNLQGTVWQEIILGIVNPVALAKFYFAPMFEEESNSIPKKTPKARSGTPTSKSKRNSKESY